MKETKKILILSLGTRRMKDDKSAGYQPTQYMIEGEDYKKNGKAIKTNFVAEPIIDSFEPDHIIILGTVKSMWHSLYASMITENNDDDSYLQNPYYQYLFEMESTYGIHTEGEKLEELSEEVTKIFSAVNTCWGKYSKKYEKKKPQIHIFLTYYGVNEQELKNNYAILAKLEEYLDEKYRFEVAFDITHSFRSLPIYNLVILNYLKNITRYEMEIKHIYYGSLEAKCELQEKAPVVDLRELAYVMDLTNAVAEFKDTGNAISLIGLIQDQEIKEVLRRFDFATQVNAFDQIVAEIKKLWQLTQKEADDTFYTGVRSMIHVVLKEKFYNGSNCENVNEVDFKFLLTKWYFKQNRKGVALATGLEALRDITVLAFVNKRIKNHDGNNRKYRENAETYFMRIAKKLDAQEEKEFTPLEKCVRSLGIKLSRYKDIRNMFAHSLDVENATEKNPIEEMETVQKDIQKFEEQLFELKKQYDSDPLKFEALFETNLQNTRQRNANNARKCIIHLNKKDKITLTPAERQGQYDVFNLNDRVFRKFYVFNKSMNNSKNWIEKAWFLSRYLKKQIPDGYEEVLVIIYTGTFQKEYEVLLRVFLEKILLSEKEVKIKCPSQNEQSYNECKKIGLSINMEEYEESLSAKESDYAADFLQELEKVEVHR